MNHMSNGIIIGNLKSERIIYINPIIKSLFKIPNIDHLSIKDLMNNNTRFQALKEKMFTLFDSDTESISETLYLKAFDDTIIEASVLITAIDFKEYHVCYIFQCASEVIDENFMSFQEVTEFLPNGVLVLGIEPELTITYANSEHYKILGLDPTADKNTLNLSFEATIYEEDKDWVLAEIYDNLHKGSDVDIEFRMKSTQEIKWVRLHGRVNESITTQKRLLYSSLKDISFRREVHDKLHMERILLHKVTELSNEILFRIDLQTNIIYFLGDKAQLLNMNSIHENFPDCFLEKNMVYEEDMSIFNTLLDNFKNGVCQPHDIRFMFSKNKPQWCQIVYNFIKNSDGTPLLVIGKIISIEQQKLLEAKARLDLLTNCFNKMTTAFEVQNLIDSNNNMQTQHIFFIIDVDNFKAINDNLGHHFGDLVLCEVADSLKNCFRKNDIIGRIGGDEFVVIMSFCPDNDIILEKATKISEVLRKTYYDGNASYSISGSIGISKFPQDGKTYEELYKSADKALYSSKKKGKDCFTFYHEDLQEEGKRVHTEVQNIGRTQKDVIDSTAISTVFHYLHNTKDIHIALSQVLEYIGVRFDIDKCYIFEWNDYENIYTQSSSWIRYDEEHLQIDYPMIPKYIMEELFQDANEDGMYFTNRMQLIKNQKIRNILLQEETRSLLFIQSVNIGDHSTFIGIQDCTISRVWTGLELRTIYHICRIIFAFLVNHNQHIFDDINLNDALHFDEILTILEKTYPSK